MNFNEYQSFAHSTMDPHTKEPLFYAVLGLASESGEVAGKIKKHLRGDYVEIPKDALELELGDVLWYIAEICTQLHIRLEDVASNNIRKLAFRKANGKIKGDGDDR